nr:XopAW family type III secretion system calcium-binding effector [uncultured Albidiferax sp.]
MMSSISSVSNSSSAWAAANAPRSGNKDKLFAKVDVDSSGGVDSSELQTLLDKVSERTGITNTNTAAGLMTQLDSNSDGSLNADELVNGITSIVPLPSTMEFAQTRASNDSFASLDADGDGKLSEAEFNAGRPQGAGGPPPAGPPPSSSSTDTTYDPLDTNKDGIVSAAEAAAGAANGTTSATGTMEALLQAIDSNRDGQLSDSEIDTLAQQVDSAMDTLQKASASSNGSDSIDLNQLAQQLLKQYTSMAAGSASAATGSTVSVTA